MRWESIKKTRDVEHLSFFYAFKSDTDTATPGKKGYIPPPGPQMPQWPGQFPAEFPGTGFLVRWPSVGKEAEYLLPPPLG